MMCLEKLFTSRAWYQLVPDFHHEVLIDGYGFWDELFSTEEYATAAIAKSGNTLIAYMPTSRKIKIDMSKISGTKANCWWYNPSDGSAIEIGSYHTSGIRQFAPPSTGDWVIVIDDTSSNLPSPGQDLNNEN